MTTRSPKEITQLLMDWRNGDKAAADQLMPLVYDELRRLASNFFRRERVNHTLQPTALVHEAYLHLVDQSVVSWQNRAHFFGAAARLMRQILIDHARTHNAAKRGGGEIKVSLKEELVAAAPREVDLIALDAALDELAELDEQQSRIVEMRFFGGLSIEETAEVLAISPATVKREWSTAKAWLYREMKKGSF
ncbi:MAG TPA: sigma-70 family RNA polymerase sigma factor [Blastocatellia bacterium]|nr:sigma-70 family RNA polymerase sigma factor [Blastocatellia bacterium]